MGGCGGGGWLRAAQGLVTGELRAAARLGTAEDGVRWCPWLMLRVGRPCTSHASRCCAHGLHAHVDVMETRSGACPTCAHERTHACTILQSARPHALTPAGLTQRFVEKEDEVFHALLSLIRDTAVLKQYAGASLKVYEVGAPPVAGPGGKGEVVCWCVLCAAP